MYSKFFGSMVHILLCVFCLIVGLSSTVDGFCFGQGPTDCVYKGRITKNGTDYESTDECIDCSCTKGFLSFCSIGTRINRKPANCKVVPDEPCSQKTVLIADETQPCPGGIDWAGPVKF